MYKYIWTQQKLNMNCSALMKFIKKQMKNMTPKGDRMQSKHTSKSIKKNMDMEMHSSQQWEIPQAWKFSMKYSILSSIQKRPVGSIMKNAVMKTVMKTVKGGFNYLISILNTDFQFQLFKPRCLCLIQGCGTRPRLRFLVLIPIFFHHLFTNIGPSTRLSIGPSIWFYVWILYLNVKYNILYLVPIFNFLVWFIVRETVENFSAKLPVGGTRPIF